MEYIAYLLGGGLALLVDPVSLIYPLIGLGLRRYWWMLVASVFAITIIQGIVFWIKLNNDLEPNLTSALDARMFSGLLVTHTFWLVAAIFRAYRLRRDRPL